MASVAEIDGLTISSGPAFVGMLDTYTGAAAGYSTRRLASATTVLMRVRRVTGAGNDGNDDEADVGYDSNNELSLDSPVSNFSAGGSNATTLGQFLNVGTVNSITYTDADSLSPNTAAAYVDEWKDQSGNGNDAEQATPASQPQIHIGTVDTDLIQENGKPSISCGAGEGLIAPYSVSQPTTLFVASRMVITGDGTIGISRIVSGTYTLLSWSSSTAADFVVVTNSPTTTYRQYAYTEPVPSGSNLHLLYFNNNTTSSVIAANGEAGTTVTLDAIDYDEIGVGQRTIGAGTGSRVISEYVLFDGNKTGTTRTDIEDNINAEFSIY